MVGATDVWGVKKRSFEQIKGDQILTEVKFG